MKKHLLVIALGLPLMLSGGAAGADSLDTLRAALRERLALSRIETQNAAREGEVSRRGAVLVLGAQAVPAGSVRVVQANTKSPRFHVHDYARVEVNGEGRLASGPGDLTLRAGARLAVLDVKVRGNEVRILTHTTEPVRREGRMAVYGCTEFIFHFADGAPERGDVAAVEARIGGVLTPAG